MKKNFEKLVTYLAMVGVCFAAFYSLIPEFAEKFINPIIPYLGPVIVVVLVYFAWRKKPNEKKPDELDSSANKPK